MHYNNENIENMSNDEAIQNVANLYNNQNMKLSNLEVTQNNKVSGNTTTTTLNVSDISITPSKIEGAGRLHITGADNLYVLNKTGLVVGKEWGGSGDVSIQGNTNIGGSLNVGGNINTSLKDCKWIGGGHPGQSNVAWPNTPYNCYGNYGDTWNTWQCPDGYIQTGIRMGHRCGENDSYEQGYEIKCCRL
jgi:hypothetical protein